MNDRVLIAGTNSGCGKTTVSCALLASLKARGIDITSFKCGPDYIDPMFQRAALGIPAYNLDPYFSEPKALRARLAAAPSLSIVEGVMGYYDGIGTEGRASTYDVATATDTPVILVVNARGMYTSAGALLSGFACFRENSRIRGVIFNNASSTLYEGLKQIAQNAGVTPLGFLPFNTSLSIQSRHLGLVTAEEITDIKDKLCLLGEFAQKYIDLNGVLRLAESASPLNETLTAIAPIDRVRVAVARDKSFCFLYEENLELFSALGAELCFFSPTTDSSLPLDIQGLYLPGGYPELYAKELSQNTSMRNAIKAAIQNGLPTIAECGGFLYLHDVLDGFPMAGVIPATAKRAEKLCRFGYATLIAERDNLLCKKGESIRAHEFHYYESTLRGDDFISQKASDGKKSSCIHATDTLYAGFPHLYFSANPKFAENFIRKAAEYAYRNHA